TGSGTTSRFRRQDGSTAHAFIPTDDQDPTELAFVSAGTTRLDTRTYRAPANTATGTGHAIQHSLRHTEGVEQQIAGKIRPQAGQRALFETNKTDGKVCPDCRSQRHAGIAAKPGWNIHCHDWLAGTIDRLDRLAIGATYCLGQTSTEHGINQQLALDTGLRMPGLQFDTQFPRPIARFGGLANQFFRVAEMEELNPR